MATDQPGLLLALADGDSVLCTCHLHLGHWPYKQKALRLAVVLLMVFYVGFFPFHVFWVVLLPKIGRKTFQTILELIKINSNLLTKAFIKATAQVNYSCVQSAVT